MAGNLVARAIVDGDQTWRLFTPFELVGAGGRFGRAITQTYYWAKRLRDAIAERRAQTAAIRPRRAHEAEIANPRARQPVAEEGANVDEGANSIVPPPLETDATAAADEPAPIVAISDRWRRRKRPEGAKA
jgi:hypothetical protein